MLEERFWSTTHAPKGGAFRYWSDATCQAFGERELHFCRREAFAASIRQIPLGPLRLVSVRVDAQKALCTRASIARASNFSFNLAYVERGSVRKDQFGRSAEIGPGDCVLVDDKEPFTTTTGDGTRLLIVNMPQKWLRAHLPDPEEIAATAITKRTPWGKVLISSLEELSALSAKTKASIGTIAADQIALALALVAGQVARDGTTKHAIALFRRLRSSLCDRAHESDLRPNDIAEAHGVSVRYMQMIFAANATNYTYELSQIRLARAAEMLRDTRFAHVSISEIAWTCGFSDPSYFARQFRTREKLSPTAFRLSE